MKLRTRLSLVVAATLALLTLAAALLVRRMGDEAAFIVAALLALCAAGSWFLAGMITAPIVRLTRRLRTLGEHLEMAPEGIPPGADEIGQLGCAVSSLVEDLRLREDSLRRSAETNRILRAALEQSEEAIIVSDARGLITLWNRGAERIFGWSTDEAIGRNVSELYLGNVGEGEIGSMRERLARGESLHFTSLRRRKDGRDIPVAVVATPLFDAAGNYGGALRTLRDMSAAVEAEAALRASEERFSKAFRSNPDFIMISRMSDGLIVDVNEGFEKLTGYARAEAVGNKTSELNLWADPADRGEMVRRLEETGDVRDFVTRFVDKRGNIHHALASTTVIDIAGVPHIIGTARDMTEFRHAQDELRRSEEKFSRAFRANPQYASITRLRDGRLIEVSEGFERMMGYAAAEVVGRTTIEIGLWADPAERDVLVGQLSETGQARDFRAHLRTRAGEVCLYEGSIVQVDIGSEAHIIAVARDITEIERAQEEVRKLNEELERRVRERTAELESFSYSISHDLRAPLRAIAGFSRLIEEEQGGRLDAAGRDMLQRVTRNAIRMGELIDDLLDFSRIGRADLKRISIDMAALAREVAGELAEVEGGGRRIELRVGELPQAQADPSLIRQVWANLIGNALKFTRGRDPAVIEIGGEAASGEARYFVRDNGAGFDMQYAGKLFQVFQRLHKETSYEGTGVGLAIVARIVKRHGGRVRAEAAPERGATFHFSLPDDTAGAI